ncbi:Na(+)/H(+) exchange regulatory cofactor NHE-RF4 isoform X2 [Microcaecilia unicolor]|uniref:Na(+)/H(+) exchange regulatory cofactor NHE-RF4 isoform X2 n=1 Tax=Microcaecilia unicolor TaxID=1415580 RepID=A0A6P7ZEY6_9AMPH|nr:Na(+)/H(+) exchange regulatory cofactor NHE-RF4 isoform X2 [Microcaecilia unicolor]
MKENEDLGSLLNARFCLLTKNGGGTFGFTLLQELGKKGLILRRLETGGPAEQSRLMDGDRLLEVNGECVENMEHIRVVQKIRESGNRVLLTVLDEAVYENITALNMNVAELLPSQRRAPVAKPRLCLIQKDGLHPVLGFGFSVFASEGSTGTFYLSLISEGPAENAGVPAGARLLEMNGVSVRNYSMPQLMRKLQESGDKVTVLVVDPESEAFYEERKIPITAAMAESRMLPYKARKLHLVKGLHGYGFLLRQERHGMGSEGQFLREVEPGLPAEKAGIKEGDRLLAVNGKSIDGLEHDEVVSLICSSGSQVTFLVISAAGDLFYSSMALSPMLFYEEEAAESQPKAASDMSELPEPSPTAPHLCRLTRGPLGFGFQLSNIQDEEEIYITQVVPGGPGDLGGLKEGDLLLEVNGRKVKKESYKKVVLYMQEAGDDMRLLVERGIHTYCKKRLPIVPDAVVGR